MPAARDRSLKRDGIRWTGEDHRTALEPSFGQFQLIENGYVTKDGTEIRRIPGWRKVGTPIIGEPRAVHTWTLGNPTTMTLAGNHYLSTGDKCMFFSVTGASAALVNGIEFTITWTSDTAFTIPVDTSGGGAGLTNDVGTVYLDRCRHVHGFKQVQNRLVVVAEEKGRLAQGAAAIILDWVLGNPVSLYLDRPHGYDVGETFSVTIGGGPSDYYTPFGPDGIIGTRTATAISPYGFTINRNVTTGPAPGHIRETIEFIGKLSTPAVYVASSLPSMTSTFTGTTRWASSSRRLINGTWTLQDYGFIYQRAALEVTAKKLLMAFPGVGACYVADIGSYDRSVVPEVSVLGMPKGMMSTTTSIRSDPPGPYPIGPPVGTQYIAVAYMSKFTDEVGLMSEPFEITTTDPNFREINVVYASPWEILRDCPTAMNVLIFWGTQPTGMWLIDVVDLTAVGSGVSATYQLNYDPTTGATEVPDVFRALVVEQMSMGAKALRTAQGFTLYGGHRMHYGILPEYALLYTSGRVATPSNDILICNTTKLTAGRCLPPAYQGTRLYLPPGRPVHVELKDQTFFQVLQIESAPATNIQRQMFTTDSPRMDQVYQFDSDNSGGADTDATQTRTFLMPLQGMIWASEQGFPARCPAVYRKIVELIRGRDVEGIGRVGDGWVVATDNEIYSFSFGELPVDGQAQLITEQHGCNGSPNAITEFETGCVGLGSRGPWVTSRAYGFAHIGDRVEALMTRMKKDSQGFMRHAIACHDSSRGLIWFGMRSDRYTTDYASATSDDLRGKQGCDDFLIWNYESDAWSEWRVPEHLCPIMWMDEVLCDDGKKRVAFLSGKTWLTEMYVFDEDYFDGITSASFLGGTLDATHTGSKTTFKSSSVIGTGTIAKVGMDLMVYDSTEKVLKLAGKVGSIVSAYEVGLETIEGVTATVTLEAGDKIQIGTIHMRLQTKTWGLPPWQGSTIINAVQARYRLEQDTTGTRVGFMEPTVFSAYSSNRPVATATFSRVVLESVPLRGNRAFTERGASLGPEHGLEITIAASSQVSLKDVIVEEVPGG